MRNSILIILLLLGFQSIGQVKLDSLYSVWEDRNKSDSIRVSAFYTYIVSGFLNTDPDKAEELALQLLTFSEKNNYKRGMAGAYAINGELYRVEGNHFKGLSSLEQSLKLYKEIGDTQKEATLYTTISGLYSQLGDNIKGTEYLEYGLKAYKVLEDDLGIANCLNGIGDIYYHQGDIESALDYHLEALEIFKNQKFQLGLAMSYLNIGSIYDKQGAHQKAMDFNLTSLSLFEEINHEIGAAHALDNVGTSHRIQGEFNKALDYYQQALARSEASEYSFGIIFSNYASGNVLLDMKKPYLAIKSCSYSLRLAKETGILKAQKESCECLYKAYKSVNNGTEALKYHEQMIVLSDSLNVEEAIKKLQQMEFSKQVVSDSLVQVEKDLKIEMAHQAEVSKKDKNRNIAIGVGLIFLILAGGFFSRWRYVKKAKVTIEKEKERSENLLLNILPAEIAEELKIKGKADARDFELASILFTDFKGFTQASERLTAKELIEEINHCFKAFDHICTKYGVEKIKTIGDAYMAAGGLPVPSDNGVKNTVLAAIEMQAFISERILEKRAKNEIPFEMRLGIHTGPVVAGIVGVRKFQYDIWGDTVNTAARMESSGVIGKVNVSEDTYLLLKNDSQFKFEARGKIAAKGKGEIKMYFVDCA